jgi:hypothetical protein
LIALLELIHCNGILHPELLESTMQSEKEKLPSMSTKNTGGTQPTQPKSLSVSTKKLEREVTILAINTQ